MKEAETEARRWYLQAKDDFKFVEWVLKQAIFFDKGCFLSQQAGEKVLKSCLYATGKRRVIGHSLFEMASSLSDIDSAFKEIIDSAKRLDRFYITTRYPNGLPGGAPFQFYSRLDLEAAYDDLLLIFRQSELFLKTISLNVVE